MTTRGRLNKNNIGHMMPVHAEPLNFATASFRAVNWLTFTYSTDADAAAALLPAELEIEKDPKVTVMFVSYGFSSVGPFRECIQLIHARFRGEDIGYIPHIFITNEQGMLAGREREGLPKLLANIDFDPNSVGVDGLLTARLCRPADMVLAEAIFRPREPVGEIGAENPIVSTIIGLRVFASPVPGGEPSVCELVKSATETFSGELWSGDGSLRFTGASELSPIHRLPVIGDLDVIALRNASMRLRRASATYPLGG